MTTAPTPALDADLAALVRAWAADDPDPETAAAAMALLARAEDPGPAGASATTELADAFSGPLEFGTAGLRGRLGAGPNRMNRAVVIRAAAGLAAFLSDALGEEHKQGGPRVVIGYDARHGSAQFALDTAAVLTAAGGTALLLPDPLPTPVLAFAVRRLSADAGVMVTASHNPAVDNGYKVYLGGRVVTDAGQGAQLVPPADAEIAARMAGVTSVRDVPRAAGGWQVLDDAVREAYLERAAGADAGVRPSTAERNPSRPGAPRIVLTPLHGVGGRLAVEALARAGFPDVHVVPEQADPDPDFPTTPYPNPEEPGTLDLALGTAGRVGADLVLALDPDADRCAVAVPAAGGWRVLTGDEVGALLGQTAAQEARAGAVVASSVVSSRLLSRIAAARGVEHVTTLTGFKWIARVPGLVFGYEEALGYCVDPTAVRDKDGIAAAVRIARLTAVLATHGGSLTGALDDLARRHGLHATDQLSVRFDDLARISAVLHRLRAAPPIALAGSPVRTVRDLATDDGDLPPTDALMYVTADDDRVIVRPSGTEPKLKCYLEVIVPVSGGDVTAAREIADSRLGDLRADAVTLVGAADPLP